MDEHRRFDDPVTPRRSLTSTYRRGFAAFRRISWGAVIAGVFIALIVMFLLNLLGLGIGLANVKPLEQENPLSGLGTGAVIWWGISLIISMFVGGWVAGRLAGIPRAPDSVLHGLVTYSVFTLFSVYLITSAVGSIVSGVGSVIGQTLALAGKGIEAAAPQMAQAVQGQMQQSGVDLSDLKAEASRMLGDMVNPQNQPQNERPQGSSTSQSRGGESSAQIIENLFKNGGNPSPADREAAVNAVMQRTGKSRPEAEQMVDNWISSYQQAQQKFQAAKDTIGQKAREAGQAAASAVSKASIFAFIGLVLGGVAAGVGGKVGEPHDVAPVVEETTEEHPPTPEI